MLRRTSTAAYQAAEIVDFTVKEELSTARRLALITCDRAAFLLHRSNRVGDVLCALRHRLFGKHAVHGALSGERAGVKAAVLAATFP
jgi:hypothetical protein